MPQKLFEDKIGSLSHSAGSITLAASRLTIGGQQYVTSSLTRAIATDLTMTANTLYMIYAVLNSGVVELRYSANVNSSGPAGFTAWKLVGAFYANGMSPVAFGSFVTIEGAPKTLTPIPYLPIVQTSAPVTLNTGANYVAPWGRWVRDGVLSTVRCGFRNSTAGAATGTAGGLRMTLPSGIVVDDGFAPSDGVLGRHVGPAYIPTVAQADRSAGTFIVYSNTEITPTLNSTDVVALATVVAGFAVNMTANFQVSGWTATPLKDL